MPRRISASIFLLGMALLVLLKQPLLAYCSCSESFFIEECGCEKITVETCPCQETEKAPCSGCGDNGCGNGGCGDDCKTPISLDLDEHFWSPLALPSNSELENCDASHGENPALFFPPSPRALPATRPPPLLLPDGLPIYLSLGVLRL